MALSLARVTTGILVTVSHARMWMSAPPSLVTHMPHVPTSLAATVVHVKVGTLAMGSHVPILTSVLPHPAM